MPLKLMERFFAITNGKFLAVKRVPSQAAAPGTTVDLAIATIRVFQNLILCKTEAINGRFKATLLL